jgi:hypothetical protein
MVDGVLVLMWEKIHPYRVLVWKVKVKVKFNLEPATKAQNGISGIALPFL